MAIKFFKSSSHFRRWLEANHGTAQELWVGFYKKDSGNPTITWPESVDEALCFGWIDGVRKSIDEVSYKIRFSPRKATSTWSVVNIKRADELAAQGLMSPAGKKAFDQRKENRSGIYSYEQRTVELPDPYRTKLKANKAAWEFFEAQPPSYRKVVCWWIVSAKKEETSFRRLDRLIKFSVQRQRLPEASGRSAQGE
jgi:uncharacterized protein YdeI (YjbR/CyaY-like superfamily)